MILLNRSEVYIMAKKGMKRPSPTENDKTPRKKKEKIDHPNSVPETKH